MGCLISKMSSRSCDAILPDPASRKPSLCSRFLQDFATLVFALFCEPLFVDTPGASMNDNGDGQAALFVFDSVKGWEKKRGDRYCD